jgi:hypothetical protein
VASGRRSPDFPESRPRSGSGSVRSTPDELYGRHGASGVATGAPRIAGECRRGSVRLHASRVAGGPTRSLEEIATSASDGTAACGPAPAPSSSTGSGRAHAGRPGRPSVSRTHTLSGASDTTGGGERSVKTKRVSRCRSRRRRSHRRTRSRS